MTTTWSSNASLPDLAAFLRPARRIVVLTHLKPDGDAVGSTLGLTRALNLSAWSAVPRAHACYFGPMPPWLTGVIADTPHRILTSSDDLAPGSDQTPEPDAILICDTGSWSQLEPVASWLAPRRDKICLLDHHVQGDPDVAALRHIDTDAAAACQPAAHLAALLLGQPGLESLPQAVATPLYLGLATDTGWFKHSNVSPRVFRDAASLLAAGVDHPALFREVEQRETLPRLRLLSRALASIELHLRDRVAVMTLTREDFRASSASQGDAGGFTDFTQMLPTVGVTAILSEADPADFGLDPAQGPVTKVSLRSKPGTDAVDVNAVAKSLGGGGHVRAAGARLQRSLTHTRDEILRLIAQQLPR